MICILLIIKITKWIMRKRLLSLQFIVLVSACSFSQGAGIGTTTPDTYTALNITATRNEHIAL